MYMYICIHTYTYILPPGRGRRANEGRLAKAARHGMSYCGTV